MPPRDTSSGTPGDARGVEQASAGSPAEAADPAPGIDREALDTLAALIDKAMRTGSTGEDVSEQTETAPPVSAATGENLARQAAESASSTPNKIAEYLTVLQRLQGKRVAAAGDSAAQQPAAGSGKVVETRTAADGASEPIRETPVGGRESVTPQLRAAPDALAGERAASVGVRSDMNRIESAIDRISRSFTGSESAAAGVSSEAANGERTAAELAPRVSRAGVDGDVRQPAPRDPVMPPAAAAGKPSAVAVETPQPAAMVAAAVQQGSDGTGLGRQIGETVVRELESMAMSRFVSSEHSAAGKTVKILTLQLNPVELGKVNIRLHSVDGELRVAIRAESDRVAQMIAGDGDMIMSTLRAAGVAAPDIVIAGGRGEPAHFQAQENANRGQGPGQDGTQQNRDGMRDNPSQSRNWSAPQHDRAAQQRDLGHDDGGLPSGGRIYI